MSSRFRKAMPWGSPRMGGSECRRKGLNVVMRHRKGRAPKTVFLLEAAWFEKEEKKPPQSWVQARGMGGA